MKVILFCTIVIMCVCNLLSGQSQKMMKFVNSISSENLKEYVYALSSAEMQGRGSGKEGERKAAEYLTSFYTELKMEPYFKESLNYQQKVPIAFDSLILFSLNNNLNFFDDFITPDWPLLRGEDSISVAYAGYGVNHPDFHDIQNVNCRNKYVFVNDDEKPLKDGTYLVSKTTEKASYDVRREYQTNLAKKSGALGIILIVNDSAALWKKYPDYIKSRLESQLNLDTSNNESKILEGAIMESAFQKLFGSKFSPETVKKHNHKFVEKRIPVQLRSHSLKYHTKNIVTSIKGKNKITFLIMAHYDHLGVKNNTIYPGADDNASGTAVVMELARVFHDAAKEGFQSSHTLIFANVASEEKGLIGSKFLSKNLPAKYDSLIIINFDMVGRQDTMHSISNYFYFDKDVYAPNSHLSSLEKNAQTWGDSIRIEHYPYNEVFSDHISFISDGNATYCVSKGIHLDYHEPTDTPDKIDYLTLQNIARTFFATIWELSEIKKE